MKQETSTFIITQEWGEDVYSKLSWFKQKNVKSANVMVVGCGALGNEVIKNLALFGIEHLVLEDYDIVEYSNLSRSILFSSEDIKVRRKKVEAIANKLREINPAVQILPICGNVSHDIGLGLLRMMDVVIGCVDNRWARYCLNRLCMRAGVPWVDGGIEGLDGVAKVFIPGQNCYACNLGPEALKELSRKMSCASAIQRNEKAERVATTPIVASIIGAVQVQEAMKLIHKEELNSGKLTSLCGKMFYYEGQHLTSRVLDFQGYDEDCPVHEYWDSILQSNISVEDNVQEVFLQLTELLRVEQIEICLRNHCFVDFIVEKRNDSRYETMLPNYAIADFVETDSVLRFIPFSELYQHEFKILDMDFPYKSLTLEQIGFPAWDILHVNTEKGTFYVELADNLFYSNFLSKKRISA